MFLTMHCMNGCILCDPLILSPESPIADLLEQLAVTLVSPESPGIAHAHENGKFSGQRSRKWQSLRTKLSENTKRLWYIDTKNDLSPWWCLTKKRKKNDHLSICSDRPNSSNKRCWYGVTEMFHKRTQSGIEQDPTYEVNQRCTSRYHIRSRRHGAYLIDR